MLSPEENELRHQNRSRHSHGRGDAEILDARRARLGTASSRIVRPFASSCSGRNWWPIATRRGESG